MRSHIIIGQEAICPEGLGRVQDYDRDHSPPWWVVVETYIANRGCRWDYHNVELLPLPLPRQRV